MSEATADITGTTGAGFTVTITSGTIQSAYLEVTNQPVISLAIASSNQAVTVASLPNEESWIRLDIDWAPGDPDAAIGVGTVTSGSATAKPGHRIDSGDVPGYIELFGQ